MIIVTLLDSYSVLEEIVIFEAKMNISKIWKWLVYFTEKMDNSIALSAHNS